MIYRNLNLEEAKMIYKFTIRDEHINDIIKSEQIR